MKRKRKRNCMQPKDFSKEMRFLISFGNVVKLEQIYK